MAENLVARWAYNAGQSSPILRTANIHTYLDNANNLIKPVTNKVQNPELVARLNELKAISRDYRKREKKIYDHYKVASIEELQKELNKIQSGLDNFSNKTLRTFKLVKAIDENTLSLDEIERQTINYINEQMRSGKEFERVIDELIDSMLEQRKKYGDLTTIRKSNIINALKIEDGLISLVKQGKLKGYRKELKNAIVKLETPEGMKYQINMEKTPVTELNYYPYFNLTSEQKQDAKNNTAIWKSFSNQLVSLITHKDAARIAQEILGNGNPYHGLMGPEDFFVSSSSELIGILGEFQTMVLFATLDGDVSESFLSFVGNQKLDSQKIGIDVVLHEQGIQVKNYNTYGVFGKNEGFNVHNTLTVDNFLNKMREAVTADQFQTLQEYYTIRAYHTKENQDYEPTLHRLKIFDNRVKDFYNAYINYYLPLEVVEVSPNLKTSNLFYFVGGKRLVPISFIIDWFIKYIEEAPLKENTGLRRPFTVNYAYNGDTYKEYYKLQDQPTERNIYANSFDYNSIYDDIHINYNFNFNMDYIFKRILTEQIE